MCMNPVELFLMWTCMYCYSPYNVFMITCFSDHQRGLAYPHLVHVLVFTAIGLLVLNHPKNNFRHHAGRWRLKLAHVLLGHWIDC